MVLSDRQILEGLERGNIVIDPFKPENVNTSSYDVCLGENIFREQSPAHLSGIFIPYDEADVRAVWGEPEQAKPAHEVLPTHRLKSSKISPDDLVILIAPGETILAHTIEFAGGRNHITTTMQARSSIGRSFIEVCKCAGWGDVGYINRWTMEITNNSQRQSVPLVVGTRVAQLVFMETGGILGPDYSVRGAYQTTDNLEELKRSWKPEMMLPRLRR